MAPHGEGPPQTAWDAIHNLVAKRLLRLRRQRIAYKLLIIVERVRYRWGSCGSPNECLCWG
ncbi:MAG TPA: hypothetical protein VMT72_09225 [Pseudolabrys sp.]|nr:hypothetical protein [Pseudolabrys sp.]